jgi:hypothetical protein
MQKKAVFPGIQRWDNVKLAEVWAEFRWHLAREGVYHEEQMSEANRTVYHLLRNELGRRGLNLRPPYGSESS